MMILSAFKFIMPYFRGYILFNDYLRISMLYLLQKER